MCIYNSDQWYKRLQKPVSQIYLESELHSLFNKQVYLSSSIMFNDTESRSKLFDIV